MKILIIGATGGTGAAAVEQALAEGHEVTAFSRRASERGLEGERLTPFDGDVMNEGDVRRAVAGQDAVIVVLGIRENPLRVRLFGPARTPLEVRSAGTRNVITAMRDAGVRRLVVQTTYGVGDTRDRLRWIERLFFSLVLKPQIADTEVQNRAVEDSGLDWVLVQPVHLTDADDAPEPFLSTTGETGAMQVSRRSVARALVGAACRDGWVGTTLSVSGVPAPARARKLLTAHG